MQAGAASDAANAQAGSAANATAEQRREFDLVQRMYDPQRNLGYSAMGALGKLYGFNDPNSQGVPGYLTGGQPSMAGGSGGGETSFSNPNWAGGTGGAFGGMRDGGRGGMTIGGGGQGPAPRPGTDGGASGGTPDYSGFYNSPGFQFSLDMGRQGVNRNAAAAGNLYAPNTMGAVNYQEQGIASQHYNDYVQQLLAMAGLGGQATAGAANNAYNTGTNISANMLSAGNANASGILASGGAWASALKGAGSTLAGAPWGQFNTPGSMPYDTQGGYDPYAGTI